MMLHPDEIITRFKEKFNSGIKSAKTIEFNAGVLNKVNRKMIRMEVDRDVFHMVITFLKSIYPPHISSPMASKESEYGIEVIYPFTIYGSEGGLNEIPVIVSVFLPLDDLRIRTLTDLVPGIILMERELMEMLGVMVEDIPDKRRLLVPDNVPTDQFPMRKNFIDTKNNGGI